MKKSIIICVTCIAVAGLAAEAQNKTTTVTQETQSFIEPPPPPPPAPPIPPVPPAPPSSDEVEIPAPPPPPPVPPMPPTPPIPPVEDFAYVCPEPVAIEIINSNGYEISVHFNAGKEMVIVKKDGKIQKIKLSTWNANRKYYEKKYGQLPPPPPPIPVDGQVEFIPPVIEKIG